jgi:hypothetical protein
VKRGMVFAEPTLRKFIGERHIASLSQEPIGTDPTDAADSGAGNLRPVYRKHVQMPSRCPKAARTKLS